MHRVGCWIDAVREGTAARYDKPGTRDRQTLGCEREKGQKPPESLLVCCKRLQKGRPHLAMGEPAVGSDGVIEQRGDGCAGVASSDRFEAALRPAHYEEVVVHQHDALASQ